MKLRVAIKVIQRRSWECGMGRPSPYREDTLSRAGRRVRKRHRRNVGQWSDVMDTITSIVDYISGTN